MPLLLTILAVLSIWDYPQRYPEHERLRRGFTAAMAKKQVPAMEKFCRQGAALLPEDPVWHYNLACSLAYDPKRETECLEELEKAIDLGFRDAAAIAKDSDFKAFVGKPRFLELLEYAKEMQRRPIMFGPLATVDATGNCGEALALGEQNLLWDFDFGCFTARMKLSGAEGGGNCGDLYFNRDGAHAVIDCKEFSGLTAVKLDSEGRRRGFDIAIPNMLFPYPVFGNSSRAYINNHYWRSISRALVTTGSAQLKLMTRLYLSNQFWVFPSNADTAPVGTNGDVFASITPYWLTTAGASWSDLPYLKAALEVSRNLPSAVKTEIVRRGLLAPVIQTLIRKSLRGVNTEADYLTPLAHPTALPPNGLDRERLINAAKAFTLAAVPPLALVTVAPEEPPETAIPELTYSGAFAWAYVLRSDKSVRTFKFSARGAKEFAFAQTHGDRVLATIERKAENVAYVTFDIAEINPTNRVDILVTGRNPGTGWGAPSYVSFSRLDPEAPYNDPALNPQTDGDAK